MTRCPDIAWARTRGGCDGCGEQLIGRRQRWCSDYCSDAYWSNHRWNIAREATKRRAAVRGRRFVDSSGRVWIAVTHWRCAHCGCHTTAPEVNHKRPANGAHGHESCVHHQDNLEVLCHDCHRIVTRDQRRSAAAERRQPALAFG